MFYALFALDPSLLFAFLISDVSKKIVSTCGKVMLNLSLFL
jgi:hypothetical protein